MSLRLKSAFADHDLVKLKPVDGHTHGQSAASRSEASIFIDILGETTGKRVVQYQGSSADVRNGRTVTRTWHWPKDLQVAPQGVKRREDDLLALVDVDYYIDMPKLLSDHVGPKVLYTFQPSGVARSVGEYKYTFNSDNEVDYRVAGGGRYKHQVWNYDGDSVSTMSWFCCLPTRYTAYSIERKRVDDDHQLVLLTPLAVFKGISAYLALKQLGEIPLKRLRVADGEFLRLRSNMSSGMFVHTGLVDSYICCTVPVQADDAMSCAARTSKVKLTLAAIKSKIDEYGGSIKGCEALHLYHTSAVNNFKPEMISALDEGVRTFQWSEKIADLDHEVKPSMVAFMKPMLHGAFCPDDCLGNDKRLIAERVTKTTSTQMLTDSMHRRVNEFVAELVRRGVHGLRMADIETVYDKQGKPSQQAILHRADHEAPNKNTKSFMKKECYQSVTDPRNISQINGPDKREYSRVCYALTDAIKKFSWYSFGQTPLRTAERVGDICRNARWVLLTDFSRMDGRISPAVRYFERVLLAKVFHKDEVVSVLDRWKTQHGLRGRSKHGVCYETLTSRLSGSPETSVFNTLLTAFILFSAYRGTKRQGMYIPVQQAFDSVGIAGGDDGLTADLDGKLLSRKASDMGQVLTSDQVARGGLGVSFLSRLYSPEIWYASSKDELSSICDIRRVLAKFHVTLRLTRDITADQKLYDKAFALHLSDANTPIIGPFVCKVLKLFGEKKFLNSTNIWNVEQNVCEQYPNTTTQWGWDVVARDLPLFDKDRFNAWVETADVRTIFLPPVFHPPTPADPKEGKVMVDGDVIVNDKRTQPKVKETLKKGSETNSFKIPRSRLRAQSRLRKV
jgi:hypothetical protein